MWAYYRTGSCLHPYPPHYKTTFASSILPNPHPYRLALQLAFLFLITRNQGVYGISTFHINTTISNLGSAPPPVVQHLRRRTLEPSRLTTYLLVKACQHLWLLQFNGSAAVHLIINHIALSWLPTALMLAELSLPHGSLSKNRSSSGFITRRFIPNGAVPRSAWPCWIPVVEHRVVYYITVPPLTLITTNIYATSCRN